MADGYKISLGYLRSFSPLALQTLTQVDVTEILPEIRLFSSLA